MSTYSLPTMITITSLHILILSLPRLCVYVCMYLCMYVCVCFVCMYVCMCFANTYVCVLHVCLYAYMYVYMCVCMYPSLLFSLYPRFLLGGFSLMAE